MNGRKRTNLLRRWGPWLPWTLPIFPFLAILISTRHLPKAIAEAREPTIRIAMNQWPGYEMLYAAQELGLFRNEGVDVQIVEVSSLADAIHAISNRSVDAIACTTVEPLLLARDANTRLTIVHAFDASHGADVIVARQGIDSLDALESKRIAIEKTSLTTLMLHEGLARAGLTLQDVQTVVMDPREMPKALAEGRVDAAVCYPPNSIQMLDSGAAHTLFSSADIPDTVLDVLAVDPSLLEHRPEALRAILRAVRRATDLALTQPHLVEPIMAAREGLSIQQFREALNGVRRFHTREQPRLLAHDGVVRNALRVVAAAVAQAETEADSLNDSLVEVVHINAEQTP